MALEGEEIGYATAESTITREQYLSIHKRMLWTIRKFVYVELRARIRANKGKFSEIDKIEVEQLLVSKTKEIREHICNNAGIEPIEDCHEILQRCYFKYISDPEFTKVINEIRERHSFILGRILDGELIPEIEHLDIDNSSEEALDGINEDIFKKLSK